MGPDTVKAKRDTDHARRCSRTREDLGKGDRGRRRAVGAGGQLWLPSLPARQKQEKQGWRG